MLLILSAEYALVMNGVFMKDGRLASTDGIPFIDSLPFAKQRSKYITLFNKGIEKRGETFFIAQSANIFFR